MELEEMKSLWTEMSASIEKQQKTSDALLLQMTKGNYRRKLNKIWIPEAVGIFVCFIALIYLLFNFHQLNTWYLLSCGVVSAIILVLLSSLSARAVYKLHDLDISASSYKETLLAYSKAKIEFVWVQKLNFLLGSILMLTILPLMAQLIAGVDLFKATRLWYWYIIGFPFFYYFAVWVFKSYVKITNEAGNILKELQD
jgi:hypothetical protein